MIHPYYDRPYFYKLHESGELNTIIEYLLTGAIVTTVDYLLFVLCFKVANLGLLTATVAAYVAGLIVSFALSRYWVFRKGADQQFTSSVGRYITLLIINLGITYAMLWGMQTWFDLTPLIGKFVVGFFMIFWIYVADKFWVFRAPKQFKPTVAGL